MISPEDLPEDIDRKYSCILAKCGYECGGFVLKLQAGKYYSAQESLGGDMSCASYSEVLVLIKAKNVLFRY